LEIFICSAVLLPMMTMDEEVVYIKNGEEKIKRWNQGSSIDWW